MRKISAHNPKIQNVPHKLTVWMLFQSAKLSMGCMQHQKKNIVPRLMLIDNDKNAEFLICQLNSLK